MELTEGRKTKCWNCFFCAYSTFYACICFSSGPSGILAGNRIHVLGQRANMETAAVISGTTVGALSSPTSKNKVTHTNIRVSHYSVSPSMLNIKAFTFITLSA